MLAAGAAQAQTLRVATYNAGLARSGPGLLLRDIAHGRDAQVAAVVQVIAWAAPDIVLVQGVDWDAEGRALAALAAALGEAGQVYPHLFAPQGNRGLRSGVDLDGDGRIGGAGDAQGFGTFTGQGAMAILSRHPVDIGAVRDFSGLLWADLPGASLPRVQGRPYPSSQAQAVQRLSSSGHWDVPILVGDSVLHLLAFHATPPVFDGPEDRNGLRNRDELRLWQIYLDGGLPGPAPPAGRFVILGDANLDPWDGDGRGAAMRALLNDPRLIDPCPASPGGVAAAAAQGGVNAAHQGDPALDTADWADDGPGNLRVDYVLPSSDLAVTGAGVLWPTDGPLSETVAAASRHRLVWVDIALP
nr:endonuclease/exonuclease/phosphatase family protein [Rhodovulum bhavnagarense]